MTAVVGEDGNPKPQITKVVQPQYGMNDLLAMDMKDNYSGFGKMIPSKLQTEPIYGFGRSTRSKQEKVYQSKQLVKNQFLGTFLGVTG